MIFPSKVVFFLSIFSAALAAEAQSAPTPAPANGQAPTNAQPQQQAAAPAPPTVYEDSLRPALQSLHDTVMGLRFEKWKGGNVREEGGRNAESIIKDLNQTLPGLIKNADTSPQLVGSVLPLARNVNALYDVSLRLLDAARISAPSDQANKMQDAVNTLLGANTDLYDRLQKTTSAQEMHVVDLETRVKTLTAAAAQPQAVKTVTDCPAPPVKKTVRKKKPAAQSTSTTPQQKSTAQKPPAGQPQKQ